MGTDSHQALLEPPTLLGFFLQVCVCLGLKHFLYKVKDVYWDLLPRSSQRSKETPAQSEIWVSRHLIQTFKAIFYSWKIT